MIGNKESCFFFFVSLGFSSYSFLFCLAFNTLHTFEYRVHSDKVGADRNDDHSKRECQQLENNISMGKGVSYRP